MLSDRRSDRLSCIEEGKSPGISYEVKDGSWLRVVCTKVLLEMWRLNVKDAHRASGQGAVKHSVSSCLRHFLSAPGTG